MAKAQDPSANEPYLVLARKYRPELFGDIIGQEVISTTLQNAVRSGRVHHAYLFAGPRGIGKTSTARILAKALNCESVDEPTPEPCCRCDACNKISAGADIDVLEIDGASNTGVDHIRELRQNAKYAPARRRFKIYYIDEVHMLSKAAFNALLKTLEEPPPRVKFIFSTTDPQMIPETVVSRCQRFDFRRIGPADIVGYLKDICGKEKLKPEEGVLEMIARSARGGLRDALGVLDQIAVSGADTLTAEQVQLVIGAVSQQAVEKLVDCLAEGNTAGVLEAVHHMLNEGADVIDFCNQLAEYCRDLMVAGFCGVDSPALSGCLAPQDVLKRQAALFDPDTLLYMIQLLREAKLRARRDTIGRVALESALVKMADIDEIISISEALGMLESPRRSGAGGNTPGGAGPRRSRPASRQAPATGKGAAETEAAGRSEKPSKDMFARFSKLKSSLKSGGEATQRNAAQQTPEGIDPAMFRRLKSVSANPTVSAKLARDKALLKLFSEAKEELGLKPLNVEEDKHQDSDSNNALPGE